MKVQLKLRLVGLYRRMEEMPETVVGFLVVAHVGGKL